MESSEPARPRLARRLAFPVGIGLFVLAFFAGPVFGDAQFFYRDAARSILGARHFLAQELSQGRLPLWLPHEAGGLSLVGQLAEGVLHPLNLVYVLLPFGKAFQLNHVFAYLLAALGGYALARGRGVLPWGAAAAGLCFAFSGPLVSQPNLQYVLAQGSVPLALAALDFARARPSALRCLGSSAAVALVFLAGDPQSVVAFGLFGLLDAAAGASWRERGVGLGVLALTLSGSALLSMAQLWPAAEALLPSGMLVPGARDHHLWSFPFARLAELWVPNAFFEGTPRDLSPVLYPDAPGAWCPRAYLGPLLFPLAWHGAGGDRRMKALVGAAGLFLWLALGPSFGLERLFAHAVPLWGGFRFPEKLLPFVALGLVVPAGRGIDRLASEGAGRVLPVSAAVLAASAPVAYFAYGASALAPAAGRIAMGLGFAGLLCVATALVLRSRLTERAPWLRAPVLVFLMVGSLWGGNADAPKYLETARLLEPPWAARVVLEGHMDVAPPRVLSLDSPVPVESVDDLSFAERAFVSGRELLGADFQVPFGIENLRFYHPAPASAVPLALAQAPAVGLSRFAPTWSVDYVVSPYPVEVAPWVLHRRDERTGVFVYRSAQKLPRVFVADGAVRVSSVDEAVKTLARADFPIVTTVTAECDVGSGEARARSRGEASILSWTPQEVLVRARLRERGLLVLNEALAPGWKAEAGGVERALCRVNGLARGVWLEAGEHQVRFSYWPRSFWLGALMSLLTVVGWLAWASVRAHRSPQASPRTTGPGRGKGSAPA